MRSTTRQDILRSVPSERRGQWTASDLFALAILSAMLAVGTGAVFRALYSPSAAVVDTKFQSGVHVAYVVVAPTSTPSKRLAAAVRGGTSAVRQFASTHGMLYSTIGIADDWNVQHGLAFLRAFGPLDELDVGRNWFNGGVERYITDMDGTPVVPQVVVLARAISRDSMPIRMGSQVEILRVTGEDAIVRWGDAHYPLPEFVASSVPMPKSK